MSVVFEDGEEDEEVESGELVGLLLLWLLLWWFLLLWLLLLLCGAEIKRR